jgi:hypothetical protein
MAQGAELFALIKKRGSKQLAHSSGLGVGENRFIGRPGSMTYAEERRGIPGQPFAEDIRLRDECAANSESASPRIARGRLRSRFERGWGACCGAGG